MDRCAQDVDQDLVDLTKSGVSKDDMFKRGFLDSLARVLVPVKKREDAPAYHVSCTALVDSTNCHGPTVYMAKNRGFDQDCKDLMSSIFNWLNKLTKEPQQKRGRIISRPEYPENAAWASMVRYTWKRQEYYLSKKPLKDRATTGGTSINFSAPLNSLRQQIIDYHKGLRKQNEEVERNDDDFRQLSTIMIAAYDLAVSEHYRTWVMSYQHNQGRFRKRASDGLADALIKAIEHLSRLPRAFYDFVAFSTLYEGKEIQWVPVDMELQDIEKYYSHSWSTLTSDKKKGFLVLLHCEMQLIERLSRDEKLTVGNNLYPYIGTSKQPCWLCWHYICYRTQAAQANKGPGLNRRDRSGEVWLCTQPSHTKLYCNWRPPDLSLEGAHGTALEAMQRRLESLSRQTRQEWESASNLKRQADQPPDTPPILEEHTATREALGMAPVTFAAHSRGRCNRSFDRVGSKALTGGNRWRGVRKSHARRR